MAAILVGLIWLLGIVSLVLGIWTVIRAFQEGDILVGVLLLLCGPIGFIMAWLNAAKWDHTKIMMIWTGAIIGQIVLSILLALVAPQVQV